MRFEREKSNNVPGAWNLYLFKRFKSNDLKSRILPLVIYTIRFFIPMDDVTVTQWQRNNLNSCSVQPSHPRKPQLGQSPNWDKCLCHVEDESGTLTNFPEKVGLHFNRAQRDGKMLCGPR